MGKQGKTYTQKPLFTDSEYPFNFIQAAGEMLSDTEAKTMMERIPLNPLATPEMIAELKGEDDPLDCIFAVEYRTSKSGVEYLDSAYEHIVETILTSTVFIPSGYGHQSQEAFFMRGENCTARLSGRSSIKQPVKSITALSRIRERMQKTSGGGLKTSRLTQCLSGVFRRMQMRVKGLYLIMRFARLTLCRRFRKGSIMKAQSGRWRV